MDEKKEINWAEVRIEITMKVIERVPFPSGMSGEGFALDVEETVMELMSFLMSTKGL